VSKLDTVGVRRRGGQKKRNVKPWIYVVKEMTLQHAGKIGLTNHLDLVL